MNALFNEISEFIFSSHIVSASYDENGCLIAGNDSGEYWRFNADIQEEAESIFAIFGIYAR